jgi:hypothetical protein
MILASPRRLARRILAQGLPLVVASQLLSSATNFGASLIVAQVGGLEELGQFSIAMAGYWASVGVQRATIADPLIAGGVAGDDKHSVVGAFWVGSIGALVMGLAGLAMASSVMVLVAISLPLLTVQDVCRYVGFRAISSRLPVVLDGSWLVILLCGAIPVFYSGSVLLAVGVWCLGGVASGMLGMWRVRSQPFPLRASMPSLIRLGRGLSGPLLLESASVQVVLVLGVPVAAAAISYTTAGTARAATLLLAPVALMTTSVGLFGFASIARAALGFGRGVALRWSVVGASTAVVGGAVVVIFAAPLSRFLLGDGSGISPEDVIPFALALPASAVAAGAVSLLKRSRAGSAILRVRVLALVPAVALMLVGVAKESQWWVFYAAPVAAALHAVLVWLATRRASE